MGKIPLIRKNTATLKLGPPLVLAVALLASGCAHNPHTNAGDFGSSIAGDTKILSLINGMYEVASWNDGSKIHLPPAVSGRWVFLDGKVMSIIHNRTDPEAHKAAIGWGHGTVSKGHFFYRYPEHVTVKGATGEPTLELRSPWEGMRSFSVEWKGDGIEMTSESGQQTWVITPEGMVYTDKEWGPEKVYAQRRWKRISK